MTSHSDLLPKQLGIFINNEFVPSESGKTFPVILPTTEEELCRVPEGDKVDVDKAVEAAQSALSGEWKKIGAGGRRNLLLKLADIWEKNVESLGKLESLNNGTPVTLQTAIIKELANDLRYYAGWADKLDGRVPSIDAPLHVYTRREPIGVCGLILPWNVPLWCLIVKLAPCLAAGNTVVVKPAEQTPLTALRVAEMFVEAGFPKGVFNVVTGYGNTGAAISSHMKIAKVAFTGSTEVGRLIMEAAAKSNLKRVQLELGGKSPLIVFDDANLDEAVPLACFAIFANNGQLCTAASRLFVQEKIYDQFVAKAKEHIKGMKMGDPLDQATSLGPLVDKDQYKKVLSYIEIAKKEGATVETITVPEFKKGYYVPATLVVNATNQMEVAKHEIFGPVQCIIKFKTMQEAIELANQTEYGLASGVVTKNISNVFTIANNVKAGTVWVNTYHQIFPQAEFGGYKESGFGREGGEDGMKEWTITKTIIVNAPSAL